MDTAAARQLPIGRHWALDDQGVALRATWRLDQGFVNLSLWEHDRCTATFHLTPGAAAELMSFLAHGLADATSLAAMATVTALPDPQPTPDPTPPLTEQLAATARASRSRLARALEALAGRVKPPADQA